MNDFAFGNPERLLLLWLLVPLVLLLVYGARASKRAATTLLSESMFLRLATTSTRAGTTWRGVLFVLGVGCLLVAAAKPRFGFRYEEVKRRGVDLVVAIDVSRSMLSTDVSPNRLERAKVYVRDLVSRVRGDRIGLVAFAGKAVPICPLTIDQGFFLSTLDDLSPDSAPRGGTAIGDAIRSALEILHTDVDRDSAIVLITDGEDHESFPLEAAASARERGVKIFTVGIGDPNEGAKVPGKDGAAALTFDGKEVVSKMDETMLTRIALDTGGAYVPARTGTYDLGQIYTDHLAKLRAADLATEKRRRFVEQYQWFAAVGFVLLMLSRILEPLRRRSVSIAAAAAFALVSLVAAGGARAAETVVVPTKETSLSVNAAVDSFDSGNADAALKLLDVITAEQAGLPRAQLARGASLQKLGKLDDARTAYEKAGSGSDPETTLRARFNLGTLEIESAKTILGGEPESAQGETRDKALAAFDLARDHFRAAIDLDAKNEDARHNLEMLRLYVKNLKDAWKKRDEEEARKKKEAEPFLDQIERMWKEQESVWSDARGDVLASKTNAPIPHATKDLAARQKSLADELPILKKKLQDAVEQQQKHAQGAPQDDKSSERIAAFVDELSSTMTSAASALSDGACDKAEDSAKNAEVGLGGLFVSLAPYDRLLKRGLELEGDVVKALGDDAKSDVPDAERDATRQQWIDPLASTLVQHAEIELPQLEKSPEPKLPESATSGDPKQKEALEKQLEKQKKQRAGLIESMKLAKEKGPQIPPLAKDATEALRKQDLVAAKPKAEAIDQLLKEIAKPLQDDDKDKNDQNDDKKQDDKQDKQDKQDDKQDKKDPQDKKDDPKQDPQKQDDKKQDEKKDGKGEKPKPQDLSQDKMEQMLQKAKAREKQFEQKKKELLRAYMVPMPVEKDW